MESPLRRFFRVAATAQSSGPLPPTKHGYQPPIGTLAIGWRCHGDACGESVTFELPQANINTRCTSCGNRTEPLLSWPWSHFADRSSLDHQARQAAHQLFSPVGPHAHFRSLTWTHTDLLRQHRNSGALIVLGQLNDELRRASERDPLFVEAPFQSGLLRGALLAGQNNYAASILQHWLDYANHYQPGYDPNWSPDDVLQANYRALVDCALEWIEQSQGVPNHLREKIIYALWTFVQQSSTIVHLNPEQAGQFRAHSLGGEATA